MLLGRAILTLTPLWERENPIVMASRFVAMRLCRDEGWQELSEREALREFEGIDRWAASHLREFVGEAQVSSFPLSSAWDDELPKIVEKAIRNWMVVVLRKANDVSKAPGATFQLRSLVREIETQPSGRLAHSGRQYKLVADVDLDGLSDRNSWDVSSHNDAKRVLASMAAQPGMPSELLAKAEGKLTQDWRKPFSEPDGLILLRRTPAPRPVSSNAEPAITPSQMRAQMLRSTKELRAHWAVEKAFCSDDVHLIGEGKNLDGETEGTASVTSGGKTLGTLTGKGSDSFDLTWSVHDVVFEGDSMPDKKDATAELKAAGLTAKTEKPLVVQRVPDIAPTAVSFARTSGRFAWTAVFKASINKGTVEVAQTLQIIPGWLGKWVSFTRPQDGMDGWAFVKKVGTDWKYFAKNERGADNWKTLPRSISSYTVNSIFFVKQGTKFVGREDATQEWPEAFADAPNLQQKKTAWLGNIHGVWDNKFLLHHKDCKSKVDGCCKWRIRVKVQWSDSPGDKTVYAIWAQDWERSNAKDWFLTENRPGVGAHEWGHMLGAYDEYTGGACDPVGGRIEKDSIMGQNLTKGYSRHFDGFRDEVKKIINTKISRSWNFEVLDL